MKLLSSRIFNTRVQGDHVRGKEKWLGYFFGPIGVTLMSGILTSYLNVYYTDVVDVASIWGGAFLSFFPLVCRILDAITFVAMGRIIDRTSSPQGKARPWILISAPILLISMLLLFLVPEGRDWIRVVWVFSSYCLFYAIGYTAYGTSHTLLVPLSTKDSVERGKLSVFSNAQFMLSGSFLAILFPCFLVPLMGVDKKAWITTIAIVTCVCCPMLLFEYYYTRERVTEAEMSAAWNVGRKRESAAARRTRAAQRAEASRADACKSAKASKRATARNVAGRQEKAATRKVSSMKQQLKACLKSRYWILVMVYVIVIDLFSALSSASTFYYCNWVLGSYNDGITQALFYGLGNMPLGLGIFLCGPICKKLGRKQAMGGGFVIATAGCLLCALNPTNLVLVLAGQFIKAVGLIPSTFMLSAMLADALDDVEVQSGERCDGFSSSVYNVVATLSSGVALCVFNACLTGFGYQAPSMMEVITAQSGLVQGFFTFGAVGCPVVGYGVLAVLMFFMPKERTAAQPAKLAVEKMEHAAAQPAKPIMEKMGHAATQPEKKKVKELGRAATQPEKKKVKELGRAATKVVKGNRKMKMHAYS